MLLLALLVVSGCGSGDQQTSNNQAQQGDDEGEAEEVNLDLKTAAEVMDYVKNMEPDQRREVLLQGARKEGGVVSLYSAMSESQAQAFKNAFERDNPGVTVDIWRASADELQVRLVNELRARSSTVDVIQTLTSYIYELDQEGAITPYFAPNIDDFPKELYDPDGKWTAIYVLPNNTAWNTNLLSEADVPNTWEDLADPKYKGKFSMDVQGGLWLYYLRETRGKEEADALARRIAANEPRLIRSRSQQVALLAAGEYALAPAVYEQYTIQNMEKGAPIDFKYLDGPVLVDTFGGLLSKNASHPYGAVLLMDWTFSLEGGQQTFADMGAVVALPGIKYSNPRQGVVLKEREIFELKPEKWGPVLEETYNDYKQIFGLTQ